MYCIESYKDLCTEIEIAKTRLEYLLNQREMLVKLLDNNRPKEIQPVIYSDMPHGSKNFISLDRLVDGINRIDNQIYIETNLLEGMETTKTKIEEKLRGLEGIKYKIAYKKTIEGKTLQQIADELGYSIGYVKNLSMELNKERTNERSGCA